MCYNRGIIKNMGIPEVLDPDDLRELTKSGYNLEYDLLRIIAKIFLLQGKQVV